MKTPATIIGQVTVDCPDALRLINSIFAHALGSGKHKPDDWRELGPVGNCKRLDDHFQAYMRGDTNEDHLANLACRALMLLQLRIEEKESANDEH